MKKSIFEDYGCEIIQDGDVFFIRYDSGESAGGRMIERSVSAKNAHRAMQSEGDAYEVILALQDDLE